MTLSETDGVDGFVEESFQHALAMAAQIGSATARTWRQHAERARADNSRRGAMDRLAFDAEKLMAVTALAPTARNQWWETAGQADIVDAYRIATAWKDHDPVAASAEQNIRTRLQERFGFNITDLVRDQQRIDAAHAPEASMEAWLDLKPGERSTAQAPESIQSAAQRWAIMQKSPDYQDQVIGQVRANNPQAKDRLVKDWMAAGSPEVRPLDPEFLAAQKRFDGREPARAETREREAEQRRQAFLARQGRTPEQTSGQVTTADPPRPKKTPRGTRPLPRPSTPVRTRPRRSLSARN